jgi:hypothetical protein
VAETVAGATGVVAAADGGVQAGAGEGGRWWCWWGLLNEAVRLGIGCAGMQGYDTAEC